MSQERVRSRPIASLTLGGLSSRSGLLDGDRVCCGRGEIGIFVIITSSGTSSSLSSAASNSASISFALFLRPFCDGDRRTGSVGPKSVCTRGSIGLVFERGEDGNGRLGAFGDFGDGLRLRDVFTGTVNVGLFDALKPLTPTGDLCSCRLRMPFFTTIEARKPLERSREWLGRGTGAVDVRRSCLGLLGRSRGLGVEIIFLGSEREMSSKWVMSVSSSSPGRLDDRRDEDLVEDRELLSSGGDPGEVISVVMVSESEDEDEEMERFEATVSERA